MRRSPWSNKYWPAEAAAEAEAYHPPAKLRALETAANDLLDGYRRWYYPAGASVSTAILWEAPEGASGWCGAWALRSEITSGAEGRHVRSGAWDAVHTVRVTPGGADRSAVRVTTSVMLTLAAAGEGSLELGGSLTRDTSRDVAARDDASLLAAIGKLVEEAEGALRTDLPSLYFAKHKEILDAARRSDAMPVVGDAHLVNLRNAVVGMALRKVFA